MSSSTSAVKGCVYLVGAGPGDPGLITVRGLELLRTCDVVLHDRLVSPLLLDEAPAGAELIFVGKRPGDTHSRQVVADALLISKAKEGKSVVRLKGGDPFVFGRGGEEAALLRDASVPFEVVPGVSSALAAPAYAGIPVTHRGLSSSFVVLTAREEGDDPGVDVTPLTVGAETIILLMGVTALDGFAQRLIAGGRASDEPAATIEWGTTGRQRVVVATLSTIAEQAAEAGLKPPATTIIGAVVSLRDSLRWFEDRPLLGTTVAVTRPRTESRALTERLVQFGAQVVSLPLIEIEDISDWEPVDRALAALVNQDYDWAVFASAHAVAATMDRLRASGKDARAFGRTRIGAVGKLTARSLRRHGIEPDLVPKTFTSQGFADELGRGSGRVLFPRVADGPPEAVDALSELGWQVDQVACYRNVPGRPSQEAIDAVARGDVDLVTFTSASTAENFVTVVGPTPPEARAVAIGPATAAAARAVGFDVVAVADPHDTEGLVNAVVSSVAKTGTM
jgi:uroporphyrinogen III methyltransferase/synthase